MKKALISVLLITCLLVALVACVDPNKKPGGSNQTPQGDEVPFEGGTTAPTGGNGGGPQFGDEDTEGADMGPLIPAQ